MFLISVIIVPWAWHLTSVCSVRLSQFFFKSASKSLFIPTVLVQAKDKEQQNNKRNVGGFSTCLYGDDLQRF